MKTQYYTAASLDGYIADPDHSLTWLFQFDEPQAGSDSQRFSADVGAAVMGSATYEWLLRHHVFPDGAPQQPWPYAIPVWVFSSRALRPVEGADIRYVRGDVRPVHEQIRQAAGTKNCWIVGGGELAAQFADHGLLDEMIVTVASVTLGGGAPLFPRRMTDPPLRLVSAERWGGSFVQLRYAVQRAGAS